MNHLGRWASRVKSTLFRHGSVWKAGSAFVAAGLVSFMFILHGTETDRVARVAAAKQAVANQAAQRDGALPIGGAFLLQQQGGGENASGSDAMLAKDPTSSISWPIIGSIDRAIDPARGGEQAGGLYPLRKAMEQLAGILIVPLILISVLHALVTKKGGADQHLTQVGIQFFTVVFLLWAYPYWDALLYRQLAIPLTETLTNGEVVTDVVRGIGLSVAQSDSTSADTESTETYAELGNENNWPREGDGDQAASSPMQEIGSYFQHSVQCQIEISSAGAEPGGRAAEGTASACYGEDVPKVRKLMHANDFQAYAGKEDVTDMDWVTVMGMAGGVVGATATITDIIRPFWHTIENIPNALADTFTGWMIQLMHWIGVFTVWFVWLAILIARAFSLCLAPVAIVWGLVPGGQNKPKKWFQGHAQIVFMPVAVALALLVFWAMMVAVLAADFGTGAGSFIVGAGVKLALVIAMIVTLWKSSTLTKVISGDVTGVASDFGKSFRTRTVQIAGTAMMASGAAAGASAGAASSKLAGTKVGGKLAQIGKAGSSLLDKFGMGKSTGVSRFDKVVGGTKRVARETSRVARNVWENRTTEEDAQSVGRAFRSGVVNPMKEFTSEMERMRDGSSSGSGASLGQKQVTRLEEAAESREARREHREELGMGEPKVIEGETIEIHSDAVQVKGGDSNRDFRFGNDIARSILELAAEEELQLDVSVGDDDNVSVDAETLNGLLSAMEADDKLRKLFEREARHHFGNDYPTVAGQERDLPDVQALLEESPALANGLVTASEELEAFERELHRRSYVAHMADARKGSTFERAVRALSRNLTHRRENETDEEYSDRLRIWTNKALHAAVLISDGAAADEAVRSAAHAGPGESEGVVRSRGWDARGSLQDVSDDERTALRTALKEMQAHAEKVSRQASFLAGGAEYGLDTDHYRATGHGQFRGMPGSLYDQEEASKSDDASPRDIYQSARQRARSHAALPDRDEVDAETFERRLNEIVFLDETELQKRGRLDG